MGQPRTSAKEFIIGGASSLLPCCCRRKSAWLKYYFAEFEGNLETSTSSPHGFFFELARQEGRPTWWISQSRILTPAFRLLFLVFFTYPSIPRWPNRTEGGVVVVRMKRREEGKIFFLLFLLLRFACLHDFPTGFFSSLSLPPISSEFVPPLSPLLLQPLENVLKNFLSLSLSPSLDCVFSFASEAITPLLLSLFRSLLFLFNPG